MKTTTILTAAILSLQVGFFLATSNNTVKDVRESSAFTYTFLAPVAPAEAIFEETVMFQDHSGLAPVAPDEATFEDAGDSMISTAGFAPALPAEADFD